MSILKSCKSCLQLCHQLSEPRVPSQRRQIRIILETRPVRIPQRNRSLQPLERITLQSLERVNRSDRVTDIRIDFAIALHVRRKLRERFLMLALRTQKHRHERPYPVHVRMLLDNVFHRLRCLIGLARVVQRERTKSSHERVIRIAGRVQLAERLVEMAHVHVYERSTVTRHHVRRRIETY